jgi:DNA repair exonuclease SbcCD nuclease subunit
MKFIHAADIHLDSPLRGLERYDGAPSDEMRSATRKALENLVRLGIEEQVAFVLIAGDVYDGDWKDYNTGLFFARQMARLREADIKVFLIRGNHDAASQITRELTLPENVYEFPARKAETVLLEPLGIQLWMGSGLVSC